MSKLKVSVFSHEGESLSLLYSSSKQFEGQISNPVITPRSTGEKTFTFSIPLKIFDENKGVIIDNPKCHFLTNQYKIRVQDEEEIQEFVVNNFLEIHGEDGSLMKQVDCESLAQFELSRIGYNIAFSEYSLYKFEEGTDPNDSDNNPIGFWNATIDFWCKELLKNTYWNFKIQSYYEVDTEIEDNRQEEPTADNPYIGTSQFYEDDRIVDYDEDNNPIKESFYTIKERIIKEEKSNIFNITQTLAATFEVWVGYEYIYDEKGKIIERNIIFRNDIPENSLFSIHYEKNLKSINRTVDSTQIVTKLYVTPMSNPNTDNGLVAIADSPKNFMRENYLLDFDWYLGNKDGILEEDGIKTSELMKDNLTMTFETSMFAPTYSDEVVTTTTEETIQEFQKNTRERNLYLEEEINKQLEAESDLISLQSQYELFLASRDSAQEVIAKHLEEIDNLPTEEQTKEDKTFYFYPEKGQLITNISEEGVKDLPRNFTFSQPINLLTTGGASFTEANVKNIQLEVVGRHSITNTIESIRLVNATVGEIESYGSFKADLIYNPLEFNKKLVSYWDSIAETAAEELVVLGQSKENGGTVYNTKALLVDKIGDIAYIDFAYGKYDNLIFEKDYISIVIDAKKVNFLIQNYDTKTKIATVKIDKLSTVTIGSELTIEVFGRIYGKELYIKDLKQNIYSAKVEKEKIRNEFEKLLSPFIREGYWEDASYTSYMNKTTAIENLNPIEEIDDNVLAANVWSQDYWSYKLPNPIVTYAINSQGTHPVYLYDVIDIANIEVMSNNIALKEYDEQFRYYVQSSKDASDNEVNYTVDYGYSSIDEKIENRGIYINFYEPLSGAAFTQDENTQMYVRIKARGSTEYIWSGYLNNNTYRDGEKVQRFPFCKLTQELELNQENVILSSVEIALTTGQVGSDNENTYQLTYGTDYYTYKETREGIVYTIARLNPGTNVPLGSFDVLNSFIGYSISANYDTTTKYYYNDAVNVMEESSIPLVTYSINVADLSKLQTPYDEDYKLFKPIVGTKILIYDKELNINKKLGYVSEYQNYLLSPQNNVISISDYKNKFEDLFERITASTVQMQNNYDYFQRTTMVLDSNGNVNSEKLEESFLENDTSISMTDSNDVVWDETGITITNKELNENNVYGKLKITSGGIFMSDQMDEFGNPLWETAIGASAINASKIKTGVLDTRQLQIWNSSQPRFKWNENGIYAYGTNSAGGTDYNTYVLFNQEGLDYQMLTTIADSTEINNLIMNSNFPSLNFWAADSDEEQAPIIDILSGGLYNKLRATSINTNNLKIYQTTTNYNESDKYYYRVKIETVGIPDNVHATIRAGFSTLFQDYDYTNSKGQIKISGFANKLSLEDYFTIQVLTDEPIPNLQLIISEPILINVDEDYGANVTLDKLNQLPFFIETYEDNEEYESYESALKLDWNGLQLGAQKDVVKLTSEEGLEVFGPSQLNSRDKQLRIQLGTWEEEVEENGVITRITKYGIRGLDKNGFKVFEISDNGLFVRYGDNEVTIDDLIDQNLTYSLLITSTNGNTFTNENIETTLEAVVYKGQVNVTNTLTEENFHWSRVSEDTVGDTAWNTAHVNAGKNIEITNADFKKKATFNCELVI